MAKKETLALDKFGKLLMERVRDEAIVQWDMTINGEGKSPRARKIFGEIEKLSATQQDLIRSLIPNIVDTTLHHLLWTLEQEQDDVQIAVHTESGKVNNLSKISDGLAGEMPTQNGWIGRFSKQRVASY